MPFHLQIQILGYNTDIYGNLTQATYSSYGLVMVAVLVQVSDTYRSTLNKVNVYFSEITTDSLVDNIIDKEKQKDIINEMSKMILTGHLESNLGQT